MQSATPREVKRATPEEQRDRSIIREQIGRQLRKHYQACTTEQLPARLVALLEKLDHEVPENQNQ
jgi:Anti-sigma factor NepR